MYLYTITKAKEHSIARDFKSSHYTVTGKQGFALHHPILGCEDISSDPHQKFN